MVTEKLYLIYYRFTSLKFLGKIKLSTLRVRGIEKLFYLDFLRLTQKRSRFFVSRKYIIKLCLNRFFFLGERRKSFEIKLSLIGKIIWYQNTN